MKTLSARSTGILGTLSLVLFSSIAAGAAPPKGWFIAGTKPAEYESGLDAAAIHNFRPSAYLKSKSPVLEGFGTLMQEFRADHYRGKRIRFSGVLKTADADWAGLWLRIDEGSTTLAFDNMQDRPVKGSTEWKRYEVVLDVPPNATGIFFGVLLSGSGEVWLNDSKIEVVGGEILPTAQPVQLPRDEPRNLDFRE